MILYPVKLTIKFESHFRGGGGTKLESSHQPNSKDIKDNNLGGGIRKNPQAELEPSPALNTNWQNQLVISEETMTIKKSLYRGQD